MELMSASTIDFGLLMVEGPLELVGLGIGKELVLQCVCKEFQSKYAGVCLSDVVRDRWDMVKRNFCSVMKKNKFQSR